SSSSSSGTSSYFNSISASSAKKTTSLNASNSGLTNLNGIEAFTNLEVLNLENNEIKSLKGLENLTNLKRLYLRGNPLTPSDLDIILSLKNLQFLGFSDVSGNYLDILYVFIPDKNLKSTVWENIKTLPKHTSTSDKITFEDAGKIKELYCKDHKIKDLRGIEHFKSLEKLNLEENMIRSLYKIDFSKLRKLEYLNIAGNQIYSLEKFEEFLPVPNKHLDIYFQNESYSNPVVSSPNFNNITKKIKNKFSNKISVII
ncbi:leucine-rich repeat domain-containing protein, partial [Ilyobacter sp.]|uniref:leucine-rich repeat domain-containing protein n=1 Tax=Ilyobacter sp. TaxID=3100343 RepID=UPI003566A050